MNLTPGTTINPGDSVNRQTIYNLLANAAGGPVNASDFDSTVRPITSQSLPPSSPAPGEPWFDQTDQLFKIFVDVLDGTGVSVWCAIGPDRFDCPMLATEPLPFGAAVHLTGLGREAKLPTDPMTLVSKGSKAAMWDCWQVVGFNNNGIAANHDTAASGTWFACALEGFVWTWHPAAIYNVAQSKWLASLGGADSADMLISSLTGVSGMTRVSGTSDVRGGLIFALAPSLTAAQKPPFVTYGLTRLEPSTFSNLIWTRQIFLGARQGRI